MPLTQPQLLEKPIPQVHSLLRLLKDLLDFAFFFLKGQTAPFSSSIHSLSSTLSRHPNQQERGSSTPDQPQTHEAPTSVCLIKPPLNSEHCKHSKKDYKPEHQMLQKPGALMLCKPGASASFPLCYKHTTADTRGSKLPAPNARDEKTAAFSQPHT